MTDVLKYSDVKSWDKKAINEKASELRKKFFELKMQRGTSGVEKPHELRIIKKNIARLETAKSNN
jgi:large subunit ribosomal protein L29